MPSKGQLQSVRSTPTAHGLVRVCVDGLRCSAALIPHAMPDNPHRIGRPASRRSRPVLGGTVRVDRSVTPAEEPRTAFLVKRQLDTPTSNPKSLHVRRSQSEQRLTYFEQAPSRGIDVIADALRTYERRGLLDLGDAWLAAAQFAYLVLGIPQDRVQFCPHERPSPAERDWLAAQAVRVFLAASWLPTKIRTSSGSKPMVPRTRWSV
jgi:AefR-like transcriptional repressor, C-terminal domain